MIPIKIWKLYILPFLLIVLMLGFESLQSEWISRLSFEDIAKNSNALSEMDVRTLRKGTVKHVVDGDTIELTTGEKVRYLNIDTPETKHPSKPVQCFGREASERNKALVEGREVYLEQDIVKKDRYQRTLAYIYLPNPDTPSEMLFVNEYLVEQGYAQVYTIPPNVKYSRIIADAQRKAREAKSGLWSKCK